ncbi:endonuclease/exonuclease/phosphatase family protein [Halomonas sp. GXIMD04776]|uniref:endonuclease/exonuclease/phosphatase family protein n=1 Tax=Halomonas sp. GXIMD04776 TaxID=3415605 RepID=UPI003C818EE3
MLDIILGIAAATLLIATLLPFLPLHHWTVRSLDFPRLQLACLAIAVGIVQGLWGDAEWRWLSVTACGLVALIQGGYILPWTPLWPTQVKRIGQDSERRNVTLLVSNVLTPNRNAQGLLRQIHEHQPDVVLTLESDAWWGVQLEHSLHQEWPYSVKIPLDNLYGMHMFSRIPLEDTEVKWLIQSDIPSIHTWLPMPCGTRIRLHAVHPRPPAPSESDVSLWRDGELLLVGKGIKQSAHQPTLVAGDLNDVAWSGTTRRFCRVSHMLDPRRGRGMFSTFHAKYPFLRWPLDHIFISDHFLLVDMKRLDGFGSDHFPILATLSYQPAQADENEPPVADEDDRRDAQETIEEASNKGDGEA